MSGKIKFIYLVLLVLLCLYSFAGCSGKENKEDNPTASAKDQETSGDGIIEEEAEPDLPAIDMGEREIRILVHNHASYAPLDVPDIVAEELTGDVVNDAAYNRNLKMEEQFNCIIKAKAYPDPDSGMSVLRKSITAQSDDFDICIIRSRSYLTAVTSGCLTDLTQIPYLNFDNPWWNKDKDVTGALSFGNRQYAVSSGDVTVGTLLAIRNIYFNKKYIQDYLLDDPYALVKDGTWTFDKMYQMGKSVAADLNGDSVRDVNDLYGMTHLRTSIVNFINSFGVRIAELNSNGVPYFSFANENAYEKYMYLADVLTDHDTFFNAHNRSDPASKYEAGMFVNNQALFSAGGIYYYPEMRAMDEDFGILPYPKYDESQEEYYTPQVSYAIPFVTVPATNSIHEYTGVFLDAYAYEGYKNIRPAFYDNLLQRKLTRDDESQDMLDFIFDNIFIDIGAIYNFGSVVDRLNEMGSDGKMEISSYVEANSAKIETDIQKSIESLFD